MTVWTKAPTADHIIMFERETETTLESITYHKGDKDVSFRVTEKEDGSVGAAVGMDLAGVLAVLEAIAGEIG